MPISITSAVEAEDDTNVVTRNDAGAGVVFTGKDGGAVYASLGRNGRGYSVNLTSGELASTGSLGREVTVVGAFAWDIELTPEVDGAKTRRAEVEGGDVFRGPSGRLYVHIGDTSDGRLISAILDGSGNHAVKSAGTTQRTTVVGSATMGLDESAMEALSNYQDSL